MSSSPDDQPARQEWVNSLAAEIDDGMAGAYVNFLRDDGVERIHEAYPDPVWHRLREVKRRYDPTNLFRLNQNIPPASA